MSPYFCEWLSSPTFQASRWRSLGRTPWGSSKSLWKHLISLQGWTCRRCGGRDGCDTTKDDKWATALHFGCWWEHNLGAVWCRFQIRSCCWLSCRRGDLLAGAFSVTAIWPISLRPLSVGLTLIKAPLWKTVWRILLTLGSLLICRAIISVKPIQ